MLLVPLLSEVNMKSLTRREWPSSIEVGPISIWTSSGVRQSARISVSEQEITAIEENTSHHRSAEAKSAGGNLALLPLGVDSQVHLRTLGQDHKALPETELQAAVAGGIGALLNMPNTKPVIDSVASIQMAREKLGPFEKQFGVQVFQSAAITKDQTGGEIVDLETLARAGAVAFTDDGKGVENSKLMERVFQALENLQLPLLQHAEVPGHGGVLAPGPVQKQLGVKPYFDDPEVEMVKRDLHLLRKAPRARYHVLHVSSRRVIPLVKDAKASGLRVTSEVSPHHLYFNCNDIVMGQSSFKMNPPIRSSEDQEALVAALACGDIDWMATDHAPHESTTKTEDFTHAAFGTLGLETALLVLLELYKQGKLTETRVVQVFSDAPAKFLGLPSSWSHIQVGMPFRGVLVDLDSPTPPQQTQDILSLSKNSCFLGKGFSTKILRVFNSAGIWDLNY